MLTKATVLPPARTMLGMLLVPSPLLHTVDLSRIKEVPEQRKVNLIAILLKDNLSEIVVLINWSYITF